jgi:Ca2+-binding RTX toxin-like protein
MPLGFIGSETQVNSSTAGNQRSASTAALTNGGYVTVWASDNGDGSGKAIMGQLFDANGLKVGGEFLVNTTTAGDQDLPQVVSMPAGMTGPTAFFVVWQSAEAGGSVIRARRFLEDGTPLSFFHQDPAGTPNTDYLISGGFGGTKPVAGIYGSGRVAFVWEAPSGDGDGTAIVIAKYTTIVPGISAQVLNSTTAGDQVDPQVGYRGGAGGLNVVWESREPEGDVIRGHIILPAGATSETVVGGQGVGEDESLPNVAQNGDLAIWNSGTSIKAAPIYFTTPSPADTPVTLNSTPGGVVGRSDIVRLSDGTFLAVYFTQSGDDGSSYSLRAERIGSNGQSLSSEFLVPEKFTGVQEAPSVVQLANGNIVISWASEADAPGNFEIKQRLLNLNAGEISGDSGDNVLSGTPNDDLFFLQQGGNDTVNGLGGNDTFMFGATMTSQDVVDGGSGSDRIELQGNYTGANALTLNPGVVNVETFVLLPGDGLNSYSHHITTVDENVTSVRTLEFDGSRLRAGENFTFRGGAETTGQFLLKGGLGTDDFVGSSRGDNFVFENGAFGPSDIVNGGANTNTLDIITLRGDYTIVLGAGQLIGIEALVLGSGFDANTDYDYHITTNDANVLAGKGLQVNGAALRANENLIFFGNNETDGIILVTGGAGDDYFVSGSGGDLFQGGAGVDTIDYRSATAGVVVTLGSDNQPGSGAGDQLYRVENVQGSAFGDSLYGNTSANRLDGGNGDDLLVGEDGDDALYGGASADRAEGGLGNDFYTVDNAFDVVVELAGQGVDTVAAFISYSLGANFENLQAADLAGTNPLSLTGNSASNFIWGNQGANLINGAGGVDHMIGGGGDDTYHVDNAGDLIYEQAGGPAGTDLVATDISYTLGANVENMQARIIAGTAVLALTGNGLDNALWANQGNNVLNGGGGADFMAGFAGDDFYFVDDARDRTYEATGGGADTVATSISHTLGANVENLQAVNIAGSDPLALTGNALRNFIWATQGDNFIDGAGGADVMIGYGGNDFYLVDNAGDVVYEDVGGGSDTVAASSDYRLGANIENLQAANIGGTAALSLTGNEQGNYIWGTNGNNVIAGRGGNDRIFGYAGADQFLFNTVAGNANFDWLSDFQAGVDKIVLDNMVFTGLTDGALPASAFVTGTAAADADDRIIFDSASGSVFYDADGNGAGAALLVAFVPVGQALTATDFLVI